MKNISIIVLFFLFFSSLLFANIDNKIVVNKKILNQKTKKARVIKDKLDDIAKNIINGKKEISTINKEIKDSNDFLQKQTNQYNQKIKELNQLQQSIDVLNKSRDKIQDKIVKIVSKELSLEIVSSQNINKTKDSILSKEMILSLSKILKENFDDIKNRYLDVNNQIDKVTNKIKNLKIYIKQMQNKKLKLAKMKQDRLKYLIYLKQQKESYDKKLNRIFSEQNAIKRTLRRLNILKQKIILNTKKTKLSIPNINNQKVRKIGSAYQYAKVENYKGPKTISPLKSFYIKRKFGSYFDPIYKIKIFNESIVLGSKIPNAKVRNVLNGKVVFAKSTPMLDNVVIVENSRGIHTIYAHLSKIAPTIKEGKRIKKGYIIGRIKNELTFEVTQKNRHINPLKLIRF